MQAGDKVILLDNDYFSGGDESFKPGTTGVVSDLVTVGFGGKRGDVYVILDSDTDENPFEYYFFPEELELI